VPSSEKNDPVIDKLNTLIKITVASAFKDVEKKEEKILLLLDLGIPNKEVAEIIGTSEQYVANVKHDAKKELDKKPKDKKVDQKNAKK
jgi:DNA-directed RNA polymerase specialized sigma24 family protein